MADQMSFVAEQLEEEKEGWKSDHDAAMECRDLEDLLRRGIGLFYWLRLADESWSKKVQGGTVPFDAARAKSIYKQYKWWHVHYAVR